MKFKLVKSNSCSSRLELAGTNIQEQKQKLADLNSINSNHNSAQTLEEFPEESVRSLVNRLETGKINQTTTPRIIESKCIEKMEREPVTINSQLIEAKNERIGTVDLLTQVTVNNHISFAKVAGATSTTQSTADNNNKNKVCRNKNVDLAFGSNKLTTKIIEKSNSFHDVKEIILQKMEENENEKLNKAKMFEKSITVTLTKNTSESNNNKFLDAERQVSDVNSPRMIKWESLSKFDDKFYVTNDVKLKDKKKYDEMEFEEFEVLDPNSECYDSLNSK